ncbi:DUF3303 family protein [Methanolobus sp. ZRKC3]|uniref:DUF3303 domain-containing protein n=1 Tax=Methanolobus sp. ZRKC3 TaxID=3125786 RepID=UPI00324A0349
MLFMDIMTWDKKDDMEIGKRYESWEYPKGYNEIASWSDLSSCRVFVVYELENAEAYANATFPWRDVIDCETIPVMNTEKAIEITTKLMSQ